MIHRLDNHHLDRYPLKRRPFKRRAIKGCPLKKHLKKCQKYFEGAKIGCMERFSDTIVGAFDS